MSGSSSLSDEDFQELKEVIKEFLSLLDFAYNYRIQKLVFLGEMFCLQNFGRRLTDADFAPRDFGSYSDDIANALEDLREAGEVEYRIVEKESGPTEEYLHHEFGGDLHPGKKEIIRYVYEEFAHLKSPHLAELTKQSWLFQNTPEGESMDFEYYRDNVVISGEEKERIADREENPDDDPRELEDLIPD